MVHQNVLARGLGCHTTDFLVDFQPPVDLTTSVGKVVCVDNESAISNNKFHWYAAANNHKVDIRDYDKIRPLFDGVDCVFHLAAHSRIQIAMNNPEECLDVNYIGTNNLLKCATEAGVKRFVNSSTSQITCLHY